MKRRKFLKGAAVTGAMIVTGFPLLAKDKMKNPCKDISMFTQMPEIQPGDIGIIYGQPASGKSKVIYELALRPYPIYDMKTDPNRIYRVNSDFLLIDLECNPDMREFKNMETVLRDYKRPNIYIDNFYLLDNGLEMNHRLRDLQRIAGERECKIWITLQANRYWNDVKIHKKFTTSYPSIKPSVGHIASSIVYVYQDNGKIYGEIIKDRYGDDNKLRTIYFGETKYLGVKK
jgi:hypothetical protein